MDLCCADGLERTSGLLRDHPGAAVVLQDFDQPLGVGDGVGPADHAVVGKQDGVVVADEGNNSFREGQGPGRLVRREGGRSDEILIFRNVSVGR